MTPELGLDPSIFNKDSFYGEATELFGKIGEISKAGKYYWLNRGKDFNGFQLVVLDVEAKTIRGMIFDDDVHYLQNSNNEWIKTATHSVDPKLHDHEGITEEDLFRMVDEFAVKMKPLILDLDKKEAAKVREAMNEGVKPLLKHFREERRAIDHKIKRLSHDLK